MSGDASGNRVAGRGLSPPAARFVEPTDSFCGEADGFPINANESIGLRGALSSDG
jgi:hypothetical protein